MARATHYATSRPTRDQSTDDPMTKSHTVPLGSYGSLRSALVLIRREMALRGTGEIVHQNRFAEYLFVAAPGVSSPFGYPVRVPERRAKLTGQYRIPGAQNRMQWRDPGRVDRERYGGPCRADTSRSHTKGPYP